MIGPGFQVWGCCIAYCAVLGAEGGDGVEEAEEVSESCYVRGLVVFESVLIVGMIGCLLGVFLFPL